jgi:hypothetical protein
LITQRFSGSRGHDTQRMCARQQAIDDFPLSRPERGETKYGFQNLNWSVSHK